MMEMNERAVNESDERNAMSASCDSTNSGPQNPKSRNPKSQNLETENAEIESAAIRVGLDIGHHETVLQRVVIAGDLLQPQTLRLPTIVACEYDTTGTLLETYCGEDALALRHELELVHPLLTDDPHARGAFASVLHGMIAPRGAPIWGVVNLPQGAETREVAAVRSIAHEVFDRTKLLDGALLMATSYGSRQVARNSIWIDVGATSVRVSAVTGGTPESGKSMLVLGGMRGVATRLNEGLSSRFPDLPLTAVTAQRLVEHFAYVEPSVAECRLRICFRDAEKTVDIEKLVRRATAPLVEQILEGLRRVVATCPSDSIEEVLGNIFLAGGGSRVNGLSERLLAEVRREFGRLAKVTVPDRPRTLIANGALRWTELLADDDWEIPLFTVSAAESPGRSLTPPGA